MRLARAIGMRASAGPGARAVLAVFGGVVVLAALCGPGAAGAAAPLLPARKPAASSVPGSAAPAPAVPVPAPPAPAEEAEIGAAFARINYLSGRSVYVEVGRLDGLTEGDTLEVLRGGVVVARLRAAYLASHKASCDTLHVTAPLKVGDPVRYRPRPVVAAAEAGAPAADTAAIRAPANARRRGPAPTRGRIGARWLSITGGATDVRQPAFEVRLDRTGLGAAHLDVAVDVRARRTMRGDQTDDVARVYRLSTSVHDRNGRLRLTAGRQLSPHLASVSVFDGALIEATGARWTVGGFSGTQPEPLRMGLSRDVLEHGGFVEVRTRSGASRSASVVLGGVCSTVQGQVDRSFGFAQAWYRDPKVSGWVTQEVDVNPAWKRALGDPPAQPTGTFASAGVEAVRGVTVHAGFDDRRNVRLWRDRETPETEFDDRARQGVWGGLILEPARILRLSGDVRTQRIVGGSDARSWSAGVESMRRLPASLRARVRLSRFDDDLSATDLFAGSLGADPVGAVHVEIGGGVRRTRSAGGLGEEMTWTTADVDVVAGRRLLLNLSVERDDGSERVLQTWAGVSWRF